MLPEDESIDGGTMTEDDIKFVRKIALKINPIYETTIGTDSYERKRLLTLLVEVEAEKDKAEFYKIHDEDPEDCEYCGDTSCDGSGHCYNDSDWQKAVRERWELGRKRSGRR